MENINNDEVIRKLHGEMYCTATPTNRHVVVLKKSHTWDETCEACGQRFMPVDNWYTKRDLIDTRLE